MSRLAYRKELDGLRTLAIIPVILFHFGFSTFSGGYVGVDIFFVLSGFLISSIIIKEIDNNTFKFSHFFMRRIRRLWPMAFTIYIFCLLIFFIIYPTPYYEKVTEAGLSSILFVSNIYFWQQGGYFSGGLLELNPFLHTWSLSVEEQFYFLFPIFILLTFKITSLKTFRLLAIICIITTSLFLAIYYAPSSKSFAAFYLLPSRMYELAIGALVALILYQYPNNKYRNTKGLQEAGVFMIFIAIFTFNKSTTFPSYNALLPVIGTALVIFSNSKNNAIYNILKNKMLVYIGLISYSLYLWHWPLVIIKNWVFPESSLIVSLIIIVICFIFSHFSFKFIETPFRNSKQYPPEKLLRISVFSFIILLLVMVLLNKFGNEKIIDPTGFINSTYFTAVEAEPNRSECTNVIRTTGQFHACTWLSKKHNAKKIFVWGDSHGSALMPAFKALNNDYTIVFANNSGCIPIPEIERTHHQQCIEINKLINKHITDNKYDLIVLTAAFNNYLNWNIIRSKDSKDSKEAFSLHLSNLLNEFEKNNQKFIIISQAPRFPVNIPKNFLRNKTLGLNIPPTQITLTEYQSQSSSFYRLIPKKWHSNIFEIERFYCPRKKCITEENGELLYKDAHHISNYLTAPISTLLKQYINKYLKEKMIKNNI